MAHVYQIKTTLVNNLTDPVILMRMLDLSDRMEMNYTEIWMPVYDLRVHEDENVKTAATRLFRKWRVIYKRQKVQYREVSSSGLPFNPASFEKSANPHEGLVSPDPHEGSDNEEIIVVN